jgi:hypothetical protein
MNSPNGKGGESCIKVNLFFDTPVPLVVGPKYTSGYINGTDTSYLFVGYFFGLVPVPLVFFTFLPGSSAFIHKYCNLTGLTRKYLQ